MGVPRPLAIMSAGTSDFGIRPLTNCERPAQAGATQYPFWMRRFQFAADFIKGHALIGGRRVTMAEIDARHTRLSVRRAADTSGVSREFSDGAMALTDRGFDSREPWTNLVPNPFNPRAWTIVNTNNTAEAGNFLGMSNAVRVASQGLTYGRVQSLLDAPLVVGQVYSARALYAAGSSPQMRSGIRSAAESNRASLVTGPVGAAAIAGATTMVTINAVRNISYGAGLYEVQYTFTAHEPINVTFEIGPNIGTPGQDVVAIAGQVTPTPYQMPWGAGSVDGDSLVIPAADAGLVINPVADAKTLVMVWRGTATESSVTFAHLLQARSGAGNLFLQYRKDQNYRLDLNSGSGTSTRGLAGALGSEQAFVVAWRPDGTWLTVDATGVFTGSRPMFNGALDGISVGCSATDGRGRVNGTHKLAAIGAFDSFLTADAQALYDVVAR